MTVDVQVGNQYRNGSDMRLMTTQTEVKTGVRIARAVTVGIYLITAISVVSIVGGSLIQMALTPAVVHTTSVDSTNSVTLTWTAPGDDAAIGTAASYTVRYATTQLNDQNWDSATTVAHPPAPMVAGTTQSMVVTGLNPGVTYYFGIKTTDEAGNTSALSNIASKMTDLRACMPSWSCTEWSSCSNGQKTRSCIDVSNPVCGNGYNKPIEQQACTAPVTTPPQACTERWSCSTWSACTQGLQSRSCEDVSKCGTTTNRPAVAFDCSIGGTPPADPNPRYLAITKAAGGSSQIVVYRANDGKRRSSFTVYGGTYRAGLSLAGGDLDRNGTPDVIVGSGAGTAPQVSLYSVAGKLITRFYPFTKSLRTGVTVAAGDVNGDGYDDLIVTPASNYPGLVRVFTYDPVSKRFTRLVDVSVQSSKFRGGVSIAAADVNEDGYAEVIAVPAAKGRGSVVEVYRYNTATRRMDKVSSFSAYPKSFNSGMTVTTGDVNGDGIPEVIVGPAPGTGEVRMFAFNGVKSSLFSHFYPASRTFSGGVSLSSMDVNYDGNDEIITGTFSKGVPGVRAYMRNGLTGIVSRTKVRWPEFAFSTTFTKGIRITAL